MKIIVPMAGRGTRVRPHSHVTPKPLLHVAGRSMIERLVDTFARVLPGEPDAGVFVLGPDFGKDVRDQLTDICDRHRMSAHFVVQEESQGTAHAVHCAAEHLSGEGIVVFADTLFDMPRMDELPDADVIAWVKHVDDPSRFGVAVREGDRIVAFVEKPKELISNEALIGIYYCRDLSLLGKAIDGLIRDDIRGHGGEFQLTDAFDRLLKDGLTFKTATVDQWLDCGTIPALLETTHIILDKEVGATVSEVPDDVVVIPPVFLADGVQLEKAVIGPNVSIEAGATVRNAVIQNSILFSEARVRDVVLDGSLIGRQAEVIGTCGTVNVGDHSEIRPA